MKIGNIYRNARTTLGLSKAELARRSGLSSPTITSIETGNASLRSATAVMPILKLRWAWHQADDQLPIRSLAAIRRDQSISQRTMAEFIGVSLPTVQALERDFTGTCQTLDRYTTVLELDTPLIDDTPVAAPKTKRLIPKGNDAEQDLVFTPKKLAATIINHFEPEMCGVILDPCRGDGAFYNQFPKHLDHRWCEIEQGRDFLKWQATTNWIVTNPPWSKFRTFLKHSMAISENIVFLCALTHFTTKARVSDIQRSGFGMKAILYAHTPKEWPQSGFQMAAVHVQKNWGGSCIIEHLDK